MKKVVAVILSLWLITVGAFPAFAAQRTALDIKKSNISHEVSEMLYGAFIEDISYACDGGLVAELVNNGSFEYTDKTDAGWSFAGVTAETVTEKPMNANNPCYERLTVDGKGTVRNIGFPEVFKYKTYEVDEAKQNKPDMGFQAGEKYDFSCYLRNVDFDGKISLYLDSERNMVNVTELPIDNINVREWTKLTATLTADATEDGALAIVLDGKGTLEMDFVSLIPQSSHGYGKSEWKYTTLRADLFEALKNWSPAFIRFPGGCLAEGTDLNKLYSWKNTIGRLEERPQEMNLWRDDYVGKYYNNTNAMGYHEYFQLCEEVGAEAVPILNVGMICQGRIAYDDHGVALRKASMTDEQWNDYLLGERNWNPEDTEGMKNYTDWINGMNIRSQEDYEAWLDTVALRPGTDAFANYTQDVLDLIEYANGDPITTYWGALRAANGHTEPFNIKYIGLGNENWGELYFRNFEPLYQAVKAKYPDITVVSSAGTWLEGEGYDYAWKEINEKYPDTVVDEHYYVDQSYLFNHTDRYDNYDRSGAGVYIGEYNTKSQGFGTMLTKTNIYTAVEEAAYMTGFERNGDIVKMSSMAPTFAKVNANCWDNNMIWFDSQEVALSPDYYNQLLFANNTGNQYIDTAFSGEAEKLYQSVTVDENAQVLYVKIVNADQNKSKKITLNFDGFDSINYISNLSLSHKYPSAPNEIGKQRVAPAEEELTPSGNTLDFEAGANSVNIIRVAYGTNHGDALYRLPETMNLETKPFIPAKTLITAGVFLLAFTIGLIGGVLIYLKFIRKKRQ